MRIALHYKQIPFTYLPVHLVRDGGEQHSPEQLARNPLAQVPTLELETGEILTQSLAMMDYLEHHHPHPSIYPSSPLQRARSIQLAEVINSGIQPLQNLSLLLTIQNEFGGHKQEWGHRYIHQGLRALEQLLSTHPSYPFLAADHPTIADFCLIPQLYNARRFKVDLKQFPRLLEVEANCLPLSSFRLAAPDAQIDAQPQTAKK